MLIFFYKFSPLGLRKNNFPNPINTIACFALAFLFCTYTCAQFKDLSVDSALKWRAMVDSSSYYTFVKNDLSNAMRCANEALRIANKLFGENSYIYASTLNLHAEAAYNAREFQQAIRYGEEHNRRLKKMVENTDKSSVINNQYSLGLQNIAEFYSAVGRLEEAEQACVECMQLNRYRYPEAISSPIYQQPLLDYIQCKIRLANIYFWHRRQVECIPLYEDAVRLQKECYYNNTDKNIAVELCNMLNNLAFVHNDRGNYHFAEVAYQDALLYAEKALPEGKQIYITALSNLAQTLSLLHQPVEAAAYLEKAEDFAHQVNQDGVYGLVRANMASLLPNLSIEARIQMRQEALRHLEKVKDTTKIQKITESLAHDYIFAGELSKSKQYLTQADKLYYQLYRKPNQGSTTLIKSKMALVQNKPRQSLKLLDKAIEEYPKHHSEVSSLWNSKSIILTQIGKEPQAYAAWMNTLKLADTGIKKYFPYLSEAQREQYLDRYDTYREQFLSLHLLDKSKEIHTGSIYDLLLNSKGLLHDMVRQMNLRIDNSPDTTLRSKRNRYFYNRGLLARYYQSNSKALTTKIDSLETETEVLEKELTRSASAAALPKPSWQQILAVLRPNEAAVEIVRFRIWDAKRSPNNSWGKWRPDSIYYAALILHSDSPIPQLVLLPNGKALEGKHLNEYRTDIERRTYDADSYSRFWQPIQEKIGGAKTIYFSPDGVYHQINLGTLRNQDNGYFLSEEVDIHLVGSTQTLVDTLKAQTKSPTISLFGYPDYQQVSNSQKKDSTATITYYKRPDLERGGNQFQPLPWTKDEVDSIQNIAIQQGWNSKLFIARDASEENVKKVKNTTVLHIATHGYFLKDTSKVALTKRALLNAGLVLAGAMDSTRKSNPRMEDGLLTAYEVAGLPLKGTELVTLSACETGLGLIRNGNGIFGLQRAFFAAGAENVLMSLWRVNDRVTKELMEKFYRYWLVDGLKKQDALSKAQKDIRDTSVQLSHPYYWGGFVLTRQ